MLDSGMLESTLDRYVDILYRWNRRVRLVGEKNPGRFRNVHLAEVLAAIPALTLLPWTTAVDIGSGNGLVAVPLAAALPERRIIALEPAGRKCTFLRHVAAELALPNLVVRPERLQVFHPPCPNEEVLWTARALEIPSAELAAELARFPGSRLLLFGGPGTRSWEVCQMAGGLLEIQARLEFDPPSGRRRVALLLRVTGGCLKLPPP